MDDVSGKREQRRSLSYIETAIPACFALLYAVMLGATLIIGSTH